MDMDSRAVNNSTPSGNTVNSDALEPLLTLALGASEEVNTTSGSKDISDKNSYMLRSKSSKTKERYTEDSSEGVLQTTPLNTPIINPLESTSHQSPSKENEIAERVVPASDTDLTEVILPEHLNLVQVHTVSESVSNGNAEGTEPVSLPAGLVMIEQSVLEQISGILKNAGAVTNDNIQKIITSTVTPNVQITSTIQDQQTVIQSNTNGSTSETNVTHQHVLATDEDDWIDTKATALQLTDELRRYHIPQAVFAKKVLNRSQGTLSDILRKPKPWNEMRLGKEIFRKMKEWLSLPEVKRIPQLRMEGMLLNNLCLYQVRKFLIGVRPVQDIFWNCASFLSQAPFFCVC